MTTRWRYRQPSDPGPFVKPEPWMTDASCQHYDRDMWFPSRGDNTARAIAICNDCPVRHQCLEYALEHGEHFGIWGGTTERGRRTIRRKRRAA